jgi:hypothetical protein
METELQSPVHAFVRRWVVATIGGWILGVLAMIVLDKGAQQIGVGGHFPVGVGMGLSIGCVQWRVGRKWFNATSEWMFASLVGMGMPFVVSDVFRVWRSDAMIVLLILNVAFGSLIAGWWQWRILQRRSLEARWWILGSVAGWTLAAATPLLRMTGGHPESSLGLWRNLGAIVLGGIVLGVATGGALLWVLRSRQLTTTAPPTNA